MKRKKTNWKSFKDSIKTICKKNPKSFDPGYLASCKREPERVSKTAEAVILNTLNEKKPDQIFKAQNYAKYATQIRCKGNIWFQHGP